ncbi:MAG: hypothetical protein ACRCU5_00655 [Rhizobiaceae bacterium]
MDWDKAIEWNREALLRIVSALFAMIAAARIGGGAGLMLPRHIWRAVMIVLRPAEAAVRRLVLIAARDMKPIPVKPRASNFATITRTAVPQEPAFQLFDPMRDVEADPDNNNTVWFTDTFNNDTTLEHQASRRPDLRINAASLHIRLRALRHALADLAKQARRLARWNAHRDAALKAGTPTRISPIRPGLPPGWRVRAIHEIDSVLRECHGLAGDLLNAPDTS